MENNYLGNIKNKTNINIGEPESFFLNKYGELFKKWFKTLESQTNQTPKKTHVCFGPSLLFLGASKRQFKRLCMCVAHKDAKKFAIFLCIWKQKFLSFFLLFWQPVQIFVFLWYGRIFWFKIQISSESLRSLRQFLLFI